MTSRASRGLRTVRVRYGECTYDRDLALCRRALLDQAMMDGLNSVHQFAASIAVSTTTISGFLAGQLPCSEELARRILSGLRLTWEEVHREVTAEGLSAESDSRTVVLGSLVTVRDGEQQEAWRVVDSAEADAVRRLISGDCPLGRALLGRQAGDQVRVEGPGGRWPVTILAVE